MLSLYKYITRKLKPSTEAQATIMLWVIVGLIVTQTLAGMMFSLKFMYLLFW